MTATTNQTLASHSGVVLPKIGFGTSSMKGRAAAKQITDAIDIGYRLIDSAFNYENEGAVGEAIRRSSVPRDELLITSKLPGRHHDYDKAMHSIEESLMRMDLEYLDLYLIHWPLPRQDRYVEAWRALIDAQKQGLVRWIGVSNFLPEHLERVESETGVLPDVNQVQLHPYFPDVDLVEYDRKRGIITEAWAPLGRARNLFGESVIREIAAEHDATEAQVVLAWHIARGVLPIPKSASVERQESNFAALELKLSDEEVARITALGTRPVGEGGSEKAGRVLEFDPSTHEEF